MHRHVSLHQCCLGWRSSEIGMILTASSSAELRGVLQREGQVEQPDWHPPDAEPLKKRKIRRKINAKVPLTISSTASPCSSCPKSAIGFLSMQRWNGDDVLREAAGNQECDPGTEVSQSGHVNKGEDGPLPRVRFSLNGHDGCSALCAQCEEHHNR